MDHWWLMTWIDFLKNAYNYLRLYLIAGEDCICADYLAAEGITCPPGLKLDACSKRCLVRKYSSNFIHPMSPIHHAVRDPVILMFEISDSKSYFDSRGRPIVEAESDLYFHTCPSSLWVGRVDHLVVFCSWLYYINWMRIWLWKKL